MNQLLPKKRSGKILLLSGLTLVIFLALNYFLNTTESIIFSSENKQERHDDQRQDHQVTTSSTATPQSTIDQEVPPKTSTLSPDQVPPTMTTAPSSPSPSPTILQTPSPIIKEPHHEFISSHCKKNMKIKRTECKTMMANNESSKKTSGLLHSLLDVHYTSITEDDNKMTSTAKIIENGWKIDQENLPFASMEDWKKYCSQDPVHNCYSAMCFSPMTPTNDDNQQEEGCQPNPFFHPPSLHTDDESNDEFTCSQRRSQSRPTESSIDKGVSNNDRHQHRLHKFKQQTSWMFSKWYDWSGKCAFSSSSTNKAEKDSSSSFILSGKHSRKDGLYRLQNVCLRPNGGISGYFPQKNFRGQDRKISSVLDPYYGTDDVAFVTKKRQEAVVKFIADEKLHTRLEKPADCYLDTKVILFPLDWRSDNPGHSFHRFGYTLRSIESAFGREAMFGEKDVTIGYLRLDEDVRGEFPGRVVVENVVDDENRNNDAKSNNVRRPFDKKQNMMKYFYDSLGTSWFAINGSNNNNKNRRGISQDEDDNNNNNNNNNNEQHDDESFASSSVCFKEVVIAQNSRLDTSNKHNIGYGFHDQDGGSRLKFESDASVTGAQTSFHLFGPRTSRDTETLAITDHLLRRCQQKQKEQQQQQHIQIPPRRRKTVRRRNPHVLFAVRSSSRRLTLQPFLISHVAKQIGELFGSGATLEVIEHSKYSFSEIISRYSNADVLIGAYGASLMWSMFMPPHAHIIMLSSDSIGFNDNHQSGFFVLSSTVNEYASATIAQQQYHLTLSDENRIGRLATGLNFPGVAALETIDMIWSQSHLDLALESVHCVFLRTLPDVAASSGKGGARVADTDEDCSNNDNNNNKNTPTTTTTTLPKCCDFDKEKVQRLSDDQVIGDPSSTIWNDQILPMILKTRIFPKKSSSASSYHSPRLELLLKSKTSRDLFVNTTKHFTVPSYPAVERDVKIVFVEPCAYRSFIFAELSAFRQIFQRVEKVYVAEYALGKEACSDDEKDHEEKKYKRQKERASYHEGTKPKDIRWDTNFIKTCVYPCREHAPFDLTISDCFVMKNNSNTKNNIDDAFDECIVKTTSGIDSQKNMMNTNNKMSATEVYHSTTNGLFGTLLSFARSSNDHANMYSSSSSSKLFATQSPERCRIRPTHPLLPMENNKIIGNNNNSKVIITTINKLLGLEFGFNLMVQQTIRNRDTYNVQIDEWSHFDHPLDHAKIARSPRQLYKKKDPVDQAEVDRYVLSAEAAIRKHAERLMKGKK